MNKILFKEDMVYVEQKEGLISVLHLREPLLIMTLAKAEELVEQLQEVCKQARESA